MKTLAQLVTAYAQVDPKKAERLVQMGILNEKFPTMSSPFLNYASVPASNDLKSRLDATFYTFALFSRTKPRLQVIVRGN